MVAVAAPMAVAVALDLDTTSALVVGVLALCARSLVVEKTLQNRHGFFWLSVLILQLCQLLRPLDQLCGCLSRQQLRQRLEHFFGD